jgi:hypothetical protein
MTSVILGGSLRSASDLRTSQEYQTMTPLDSGGIRDEMSLSHDGFLKTEASKTCWKTPSIALLIFGILLSSFLAASSGRASTDTTAHGRQLGQNPSDLSKAHQKRPRVLYVVTTLNEYNSGTRSTTKGSDRLQQTLIPVVSEGIRSMLTAGYDVDLYLVCHFSMRPERQAVVRAALPDSVGLEVWSDATPLGYDTGKDVFGKLENRTLHLARQHRFVIKDKLAQYDMFVNFEDDMLIKGEHLDHFVKVTNELQRLHDTAPDDPPGNIQSSKDATDNYHGIMTKGQLRRMIPGFVRVEVLLDEINYPAQSKTGPVPLDLTFRSKKKSQVDPKICCHVSDKTTSEQMPKSPKASDLMLWETNVVALGIRQMPKESWLDWVLMQRGPSQTKLNVSDVIGDYWSNRNNDYWKNERRATPLEFKYINNQGGWMATREQLWRWHTEICPGGFLPPYEEPHYRFDGLDMRNVEWYSGGMQLSTVRHACNMQRIILLDPDQFSKSLIYHTANNKQRQLADKRESSFVKANTLLGQLNTLRKRAEKELSS